MADFDDPSSIFFRFEREASKLRPEFSSILKACREMGSLFVLLRNEACILGSVADPLQYLETAGIRLAAGGALTLNLARRQPCSVFSYIEPGPRGGLIDAVEFCYPFRAGFLKVCRMDQTNRDRWLSMLSTLRSDAASPASIAGIRKTNHLQPWLGNDRGPSPAEIMIERFLESAVRNGATLHITARTSGGRGRLVLQPTHRVKVRHWNVLSANDTALHLAAGCVTELRVLARPNLVQLILFGARGRFIARVLTRDREMISQFGRHS